MDAPRLISAPDVPVARWHVSPAIDIAAYALSWVWVLVPLLLLGNTKAEYLGVFVFVLILTDLHRHFGLPYVYLDSQIRRRFRVRFFVLPSLLLIVWFGSPFFKRFGPALSPVGVAGLVALVAVVVQMMRRDTDGGAVPWRSLATIGIPVLALFVGTLAAPPDFDPGWAWLAGALVASVLLARAWPRPRERYGTAIFVLVLSLLGTFVAVESALQVRPRDVIAGVAIVAGAWNIWHVLMQKYGILRLYRAKSGSARTSPGWVDRLLLFAWIPLFLLWVGPANRDAIWDAYPQGRKTLTPILDTMQAAQPMLMAPAIALVVAAIGLFLWHERRADGFGNAPRLWLAAGTTALSAAFFFAHPLKVYLAFGFSHAIEYCVFVWAFQRRRYAKPLRHAPLLARLVKHPARFYGAFVLGGGALVFVLSFYGRNVFAARDQPYFLGLPTAEWFMYWGLYQSMVHFYFDSFLWKMRHDSTRAHI